MKRRLPGYSFGRSRLLFFITAWLIVSLLFHPGYLFSQDITSLNIEKVQDDGLKNGNILCISQDRNGFMWFGTLEGFLNMMGTHLPASAKQTASPRPLSASPSIHAMHSRKCAPAMHSRYASTHDQT
jgi:hypothetical protein